MTTTQKILRVFCYLTVAFAIFCLGKAATIWWNMEPLPPLQSSTIVGKDGDIGRRSGEASAACYSIASYYTDNATVRAMVKDRFLSEDECDTLRDIYQREDNLKYANERERALKKFQ